jgi:hypothetical protein
MSDRSQAPSPAELTLARLLGNVSSSTFFAEYWGKKPLLLRRGAAGFYRNVFSLADIDTLIFAGRFRPGEFRIARADEGIDLQFRNVENPDAVPPVTTFYRAFDEGNSIVLHGLHLRWPAMAVVTRYLEAACACGVTTNVYLTPPNAQAYPLHYDTHDFFIFQLHGRKQWRVFEESAMAKPVRELGPLSSEAWSPGPLREEFELDDGDLLYVPRGFGHEVISKDSTSLHLTVGLHGMTWYRLATSALAQAASASEPLRTFIPVTPSPCGAGRLDLTEAAPVLGNLQLDAQAALDVWRKSHREASDPVPDGHWVALDRARELGGCSLVARRFGLEAAIVDRGERVQLQFLQEKVDRPAAARQALEYVAAADRFSVDSIPSLTSEERIELARELVRRGFLTIVNTGAAGQSIAAIPVENQIYPAQGASPMNYHTDTGASRVSPMNDTPSEVKNDSAQTVTPSGGCGCSSCSGSEPIMTYAYAIGRISARFPSIDIEKELYQVVRGTDTAKLTDSQVLYQVLSQPDNAYLAREMCWVFSVRGVETFTIIPRSGLELTDLVNALNLAPSEGATNVVIGTRSLPLPASACGGLSLPSVVASKIYSFNLDEFVKELPLNEQQVAAGKELLARITHLIDNVGDMDEHRAINYLALRYLAMYSLVVDNFNRDFSLQGVQVRPSATRSNRKLVDVTLKFTSRKTDVRESYGLRVDVTGMFPFLVTPLHPVFEKDA